MERNLLPPAEEDILTTLHQQDRDAGISPVMTDTEFLLDLYTIAPLGVAVCTTKEATQIINLRLKRAGIENYYSEQSIRQKITNNEEEYNRPDTTRLFPLTDDEERHFFGTSVGNMNFYLVRDVLSVRLSKYKGEKPVKPRLPRGRPRVRPENELKGSIGRPVSSTSGKILALARKLQRFYEKKDTENIENILKELEQTVRL